MKELRIGVSHPTIPAINPHHEKNAAQSRSPLTARNLQTAHHHGLKSSSGSPKEQKTSTYTTPRERAEYIVYSIDLYLSFQDIYT